MKRVYTTDGAEIRIGSHGVATGTVPALVPDEVADELRREMKGEKPFDGDVGCQLHRGEPCPAGLPKDDERHGKPRTTGRKGHKRYRIEDDEPPPKAIAAPPSAPAVTAEKGKE